ncbi:cell division protein FtsQ/DivIB [Desulfogranum mediterraneum]|uniref:cell division protein FtsQ/DivIB n=1 Tax=Desulfogranum mediterraneum TaxID=160661 RepID=UPI0013784427|nr:FtsQ-type POTRA domain-containing protein [Desulfogranum mediterraneum]
MAAYTPGSFSSPPGQRKARGKLLRRLRAWWARRSRQRRGDSPGVQAVVSGFQRELRLKRFSRGMVTLVILGCSLAGIFWLLSSVLIHSEVFRLTDIQVSGNRITPEAEILEAGALEKGKSLLLLERGAVAARIAALAWIDRVTVKRQWPSTIRVVVREHRPLALINVETGQGNQLFYLNRQGVIFTPLGQGEDFDFPVITGLAWLQAAAGQQLPRGSLAESAILLLKRAAQGNAILPIQSISEIHLDEEQGLVVYLVDRPFPIYFGTRNILTKYGRLVKIMERLYRKKKMQGITAIRMDYAKNKILVARTGVDR